jgi:EAL domain-containing protein (putative c-di-GMP-specific phosphodiesterase class I)
VTDPTFRSDIERLIHQYKVPPEKLCFEITETTAITNMYTATAFIAQLQKLGFSVALDDFGSGLSSFEYLKKFPVDILKIDGIFIQNLPQSKTDSVIVDAIGRVAQSMNLKTVAEYVESEEILKLLADIGVTYAQGFFTGKPVPLKQLLKKHNKSDR